MIVISIKLKTIKACLSFIADFTHSCVTPVLYRFLYTYVDVQLFIRYLLCFKRQGCIRIFQDLQFKSIAHQKMLTLMIYKKFLTFVSERLVYINVTVYFGLRKIDFRIIIMALFLSYLCLVQSLLYNFALCFSIKQQLCSRCIIIYL